MPEGNSDLERISGSEPLPASLEPVRAPIPVAWDPVTPRGVAAFASARWPRFLTIVATVAVIAAATVVWFILYAWVPIVTNTIARLPDTGVIEAQQLQTPHTSLEPIAINTFLGIGVDLEARSNANVPTDIFVKFHRQEVLVCSFLGCEAFAYPKGYTIQFNRRELQPGWGAWKTMIFGGAFVVLVPMLLTTWLVLGLIYAPVVWLVARRRGRKLNGGASWRLASACNLPGALLLTLAIIAYGIGPLSLVLFCVVAVGHFFPAWVYLFLCPMHLPVIPRQTDTTAPNPFLTTGSSTAETGPGNLFGPKT